MGTTRLARYGTRYHRCSSSAAGGSPSTSTMFDSTKRRDARTSTVKVVNVSHDGVARAIGAAGTQGYPCAVAYVRQSARGPSVEWCRSSSSVGRSERNDHCPQTASSKRRLPKCWKPRQVTRMWASPMRSRPWCVRGSNTGEIRRSFQDQPSGNSATRRGIESTANHPRRGCL